MYAQLADFIMLQNFYFILFIQLKRNFTTD